MFFSNEEIKFECELRGSNTVTNYAHQYSPTVAHRLEYLGAFWNGHPEHFCFWTLGHTFRA